jgi:phage terminase small subunit
MTGARHQIDKALTPKQARFVEEYLIDLNGTQAAIRAGYSARSARDLACEMLDKAHIAKAVEKRIAARAKKTGLTAERVLRELAAVGLSDIRKFYDESGELKPVHELDDEAAAALAGVEVEELYEGRGDERKNVGRLKRIKRFDKVRALELAGKHLGLWDKPPEPEKLGPGLTIVVQNGVQVDGQRVTQAARVVVDLQGPE